MNQPLRAPVRRSGGLSLAGYFAALVATVLIPTLVLAAYLIQQAAVRDYNTARRNLSTTAHALKDLVDNEIETHLAIATILARAPSLQREDLATFEASARKMLQSLTGKAIVVADREGTQLINTVRPASSPPQRRGAFETQERVFKTGKPHVSNVFEAVNLKRWIATLEVPVEINGEVKYVLAIILDPNVFYGMLQKQLFPEDWLAGIIDRNGRFVARLRSSERVGSLASEGWRQAAANADRGWVENVSLEGERLFTAFENSTYSGWSVAVAAPQTIVNAPYWRAMIIFSFITLAVILVSGGLAFWVSRRIQNRVVGLQRNVDLMFAGHAVAPMPHVGIRELDALSDGVVASGAKLAKSVEMQNQAKTRLELVNRELHHRVGNLLTIAQAIVSLSYKPQIDSAEFKGAITKRLQSLSHAIQLLNRYEWVGVRIHELVKMETQPVADKVGLAGPDYLLHAKAAQSLALLFYELVSNAAKYGALANSEGSVSMSWQIIERPGSRVFLFHWKESGGIEVKAPARQGFGTHLLARLVPSDLSGRATLSYERGGFRYDMEAPANEVVSDDDALSSSNIVVALDKGPVMPNEKQVS